MEQMKTILTEWREWVQLNESNLSRLYKHILEHDCAVISAYRDDPSDISNCVDKTETTKTNKERSVELKGILLGLKYGVTRVDGSYIEKYLTPQAKIVDEESYFCANLNNDPSFFENIQRLGAKYCQDSVLCIPQGGQEPYLLGTNEGSFPGLDNKNQLGSVAFGKEAEFMTRIRKRPMTFPVTEAEETLTLETYNALPRLQRMSVSASAKRFLSENK